MSKQSLSKKTAVAKRLNKTSSNTSLTPSIVGSADKSLSMEGKSNPTMQLSGLCDPRLHIAQRQTLAHSISGSQGNRYLQHMFVQRQNGEHHNGSVPNTGQTVNVQDQTKFVIQFLSQYVVRSDEMGHMGITLSIENREQQLIPGFVMQGELTQRSSETIPRLQSTIAEELNPLIEMIANSGTGKWQISYTRNERGVMTLRSTRRVELPLPTPQLDNNTSTITGEGGTAPNPSTPQLRGSVPNIDIQYELISRVFAYDDKVDSPVQIEILKKWGYHPQWYDKINDKRTGFFVGLLMPDTDNEHYTKDLRPILAFRGTQGVDWLTAGGAVTDFISDADPTAVGWNQFANNRRLIQALIGEAGGTVDVTGHSLGGALAQHTAVEFSESVGRVITFQAPGVNLLELEKFKKDRSQHEIRHHIASSAGDPFKAGDFVDLVGTHLPGEVFEHSVSSKEFMPHLFHLLNTPELADQRKQLGLDEAILGQLRDLSKHGRHGITNSQSIAPIRVHSESSKDPHEMNSQLLGGARTLAALRLKLGGELGTLLGITQLIQGDDTQTRLDTVNHDDMMQKRPIERASMISRLCQGATLDADEQAILTLLHVSKSKSDLVQVVDAADAWKICKAVDGDEYKRLREILKKEYYAKTSRSIAQQLIQQCMDGETAEWEEEMIADILVTRAASDGTEIIKTIGKQIGGNLMPFTYYPNKDFGVGFEEIKWQLDGADQVAVEAAYKVWLQPIA